jgi:hypothetical protein
VATITITFANSKLTKVARGIDPRAFEENPPTTVAEGEAIIKQWLVKHLKIAFRRGDKATFEDGFVPEDGPTPTL